MLILKITIMRKLIFAAAFLIAIGGAIVTKANSSSSSEEAYYRNPDVAHCTDSGELCTTTDVNPCTLSNGKQGYESGCVQVLFKP